MADERKGIINFLSPLVQAIRAASSYLVRKPKKETLNAALLVDASGNPHESWEA